MYTMCMPGAQGGQKKVSDPSGFGVVSHHVSAGDCSQVLGMSNKCSKPSLQP